MVEATLRYEARADFLGPFRQRQKHRDRLIASLLTLALYVGFGALLKFDMPRRQPTSVSPRETEVSLLPIPPKPPPPISFIAHFLKERTVNTVPPQFTILNPNSNNQSPVAAAEMVGTSSTASTAPSNGNGTESSVCIDPAYLASITAHLKPYFVYPPYAVVHRIQGAVYVHFILDKSGTVLFSEVAKGSGFSVLDDAALSLVGRAQPFPPIPDRIRTDRIDGLLPIAFGIEPNGFRLPDGPGPGCN
jgi:TonB family protein